MDNKKDWEELENWNKLREKEVRDKYGIDINKIKGNTSKIDNFTYILTRISKKLYIIMCLIVIIIFIFGISFFANTFIELSNRLDINILKEVENYVGLDFEIENQEVDEKGNGKYYLRCKEGPNIQCLAIKDGGNFQEDYSANALKYFFENWNNNYKENFNVEEYRDLAGLLNYSIWIEIDEFSKIDETIDAIYELKEMAGEYSGKFWHIEIRDNAYTDVVQITQNIEKSRTYAKINYVIWHKDNGYNIEKEIFEKYYKPELLTVYLNNKKINEDKAFYDIEKSEYKFNIIALISYLGLKAENDWTRRNKFIYI